MISKTGQHAIQALTALARRDGDEFVGAAALAAEIGAPPNYLGKLLQTLAREGLVSSQKGMGGGFRLVKPSHDISLYDVVEPIEQVSRWNGCVMGRPTCSPEHACPIHARWQTVRDTYLTFLRQTTLAELAGAERLTWTEG